jgi:hypothetical protein
MLFLEYRSKDHLLQKRKSLFNIFLETRKLKDKVEILFGSDRMKDIKSCRVIGKLRREIIVGIAFGRNGSI